MESAGASYICVHGRTPTQRSEPANHEAIALVKSAMRIPIIANGAIGSYQEALQVAKRTQTDGTLFFVHISIRSHHVLLHLRDDSFSSRI